MLERKLQDAEVPVEEQNNILKHLEKKETEYMRLQRHKMGVEDFELLTIIGRGAFGEVLSVLSLRSSSINQQCDLTILANQNCDMCGYLI